MPGIAMDTFSMDKLPRTATEISPEPGTSVMLNDDDTLHIPLVMVVGTSNTRVEGMGVGI